MMAKPKKSKPFMPFLKKYSANIDQERHTLQNKQIVDWSD